MMSQFRTNQICNANQMGTLKWILHYLADIYLVEPTNSSLLAFCSLHAVFEHCKIMILRLARQTHNGKKLWRQSINWMRITTSKMCCACVSDSFGNFRGALTSSLYLRFCLSVCVDVCMFAMYAHDPARINLKFYTLTHKLVMAGIVFKKKNTPEMTDVTAGL